MNICFPLQYESARNDYTPLERSPLMYRPLRERTTHGRSPILVTHVSGVPHRLRRETRSTATAHSLSELVVAHVAEWQKQQKIKNLLLVPKFLKLPPLLLAVFRKAETNRFFYCFDKSFPTEGSKDLVASLLQRPSPSLTATACVIMSTAPTP